MPRKRIIRTVVGFDDSTALSINTLFTTIEVKKTISGKPNEGFSRINNLGKASSAKIIESGVRVRIFAGHDDEPVLIHDGDIRRFIKEKQPPEKFVEIELGGNTLLLNQAFFNRSYAGQVAVKTIVQDAIPTFNIEGVDLDQIPDDAYLYDYSFTGKTGVMLDSILNPINVNWFENDNFIRFSQTGQALETVVVLNEESGLIGSPKETEKGVEFTSVLNGRINLNGRVKIESETVNGIYKVASPLIHKGDNRDGEFVTMGLGVDIE